MSEHRTDEEKTKVAMAQLDGLADLWWAQSGYPAMDLPDRFVKMVKASYAEGLYNGRCSAIDEPPPVKARPISEWHEDIGPVIWWRFCRDERPDEASWIGTPLDDDWPGYHTHWTPHPVIPQFSKQGIAS